MHQTTANMVKNDDNLTNIFYKQGYLMERKTPPYKRINHEQFP